jgi:hypothetical protein
MAHFIGWETTTETTRSFGVPFGVDLSRPGGGEVVVNRKILHWSKIEGGSGGDESTVSIVLRISSNCHQSCTCVGNGEGLHTFEPPNDPSATKILPFPFPLKGTLSWITLHPLSPSTLDLTLLPRPSPSQIIPLVTLA